MDAAGDSTNPSMAQTTSSESVTSAIQEGSLPEQPPQAPMHGEMLASTEASVMETDQEEADTEHDGVDTEIGEEEEGLDEQEGTDLESERGGAGDGVGDSLTPQQRARHAITGRGVTLSMLMADGVIEPGEDNMSIEYLGQKFTADLLGDGRIRWREEDKVFGSPSAWAIHCKKIVNPMKKSGCGWASVKYKGKKLNSLKSTWTRKQRPLSNLVEGALKEEDGVESSECDDTNMKEESIMDDESTNQSAILGVKFVGRAAVKHASLGRKSHLHDPTTLIECTPFAALGKIQPFTVTMTTNALLIMDLHSHISTSEVVGYLAGTWDNNTQCVTISASYPMLCRLSDKEGAATAEAEIQTAMARRGLSLLGWYHSHPACQPDPSIRDVETQMEHQLTMMSPSYHPCIGLILSAYDPRYRQKVIKDTAVRMFWVMPPPEQRPLDYGMPMSLHYDLQTEPYMLQDELNHINSVVDFYKGEPDFVDFSGTWQNNITNMEKLKASLERKLPKDQQDGKLLRYIEALLTEETYKTPLPPHDTITQQQPEATLSQLLPGSTHINRLGSPAVAASQQEVPSQA